MQTAYWSSWCLKTEVGTSFFAFLLFFADNILTTIVQIETFQQFAILHFSSEYLQEQIWNIERNHCSVFSVFMLAHPIIWTSSSSWLQGLFSFLAQRVGRESLRRTAGIMIIWKWDPHSMDTDTLENNCHQGWTKREIKMKTDLKILTALDG